MKTIKEWMPNGVFYDPEGQLIFAPQENGHMQRVVDIRGWGALQQKFSTHEEAAAFQDEVGKFIAEAINDKLAREKTIKEYKL